MNDPSDGVPQTLIQHIHLVSTSKFPTLPQVSIETVIEYLLQAPNMARSAAPFNWMFLDAPTDGTVMLVWQPLAKLGIRFASDGYVWGDAEQAFSQEHRGYMVEMYIHRMGYHPPQEPMATHCRRRYRLTPSPSNPSIPCDPGLWIVHYSRADTQNQLPSRSIPVHPQVQAMMTQRRYLQQHGQLVRKEFMLHDRSNWPTINLPGGHMPQFSPQAPGYPGNVMSQMSRSQQQSYVQDLQHQATAHQAGIGPSPSKKQRQAAPSQRQGSGTSIAAAAIANDSAVDDEEDNWRGDLMDLLTPRDISTMRYTQHHEWMEEIFSSPYSTGQIIPVELGLGRKGELESLTKGFFNAPTEVSNRTEGLPDPTSGRLESGKADDFTALASAKITEINHEIEKMKKSHEKKMARVSRASPLVVAERTLRSLVSSSSETGTDSWNGEQLPAASERDLDAAAIRQQHRIVEVANEVENALGKRIQEVKEVNCVQKPESPPAEEILPPSEPSQAADFLADSNKPDLVNEELPMATAFTPEDFFNANTHDDVNTFEENITMDPDNAPVHDTDIAMSEVPAAISELPAVEEPASKGIDPNEWVMVDKEGLTEDPRPQEVVPAAEPALEAEANDVPVLNDLPSVPKDAQPDLPLASTLDAPLDVPLEAERQEGFVTNSFDEGVDFGNLDTAGDALAVYGDHEAPDLDTNNHAELGALEDSAFGDAFHQPEPNELQPETERDFHEA